MQIALEKLQNQNIANQAEMMRLMVRTKNDMVDKLTELQGGLRASEAAHATPSADVAPPDVGLQKCKLNMQQMNSLADFGKEICNIPVGLTPSSWAAQSIDLHAHSLRMAVPYAERLERQRVSWLQADSAIDLVLFGLEVRHAHGRVTFPALGLRGHTAALTLKSKEYKNAIKCVRQELLADNVEGEKVDEICSALDSDPVMEQASVRSRAYQATVRVWVPFCYMAPHVDELCAGNS